MAEHSYPTPSRNQLSGHNRESAKACVITNGTRTVATRVRHGVRLPDGTIVYRTRSDAQMTDADWDRLNRLEDKRQRAQRISDMVSGRIAQVDTWASKS